MNDEVWNKDVKGEGRHSTLENWDTFHTRILKVNEQLGGTRVEV